MKTFYTLTTREGQTFFSVKVDMASINDVYLTLEDAINAIIDPYALEMENGEIIREGVTIGHLKLKQKVPEDVLEEVKKVMGIDKEEKDEVEES